MATGTKLNLGSGERDIPGYLNLDHKLGSEVYPLTDYQDNSVDEVRASHILEHFSHRETAAILREWVRVLKPGGWLKIAVPDFEFIVKEYVAGNQQNLPLFGYLMGGQVDELDFHKAVFDQPNLHAMLSAAGLVDIREWESEIIDCATLPVSLNLEGRKAANEHSDQI